MSKFYVVSGSAGHMLAHAGETHDTIEEDAQHTQEVGDEASESGVQDRATSSDQREVSLTSTDSGFEPPVIHSSLVTSLILVAIVVALYATMKKLNVSFLIRYFGALALLIILSAVYVMSTPEVTAITVGFGFFAAFIITIAMLKA